MQLLVPGGNGFIGRRVCRLAVERGHDVVSLSRSGRPASDAAWTAGVRWVAADVFDVDAWRKHLGGCDAVIHSIGIVREHPEKDVTFERMNGEAAEVVADAAEAAGVEAMIYLSAALTPPGVSPRYLMAKRRAEAYLRKSSLRHVLLRPALAYGTGGVRSASILLGKLGEGAMALPGLSQVFAPVEPLPAEQVAAAAVHAAATPEVQGTYETPHIRRLALHFDPSLAVSPAGGLATLGGVAGLGLLGAAALAKKVVTR